MDKYLHYLMHLKNHNYSYTENNHGKNYSEGELISRDINELIYYLTIAANLNNPDAQYILGITNFLKVCIPHNNKMKGVNLIILSSENGCKFSYFMTGFFYYEGKYVRRDIDKAIHYFKKAAIFKDQFAKNNLGIFYKYGFGDKYHPKYGAEEYFEEAIREKQDEVAMYNLSHIYIYELSTEEYIEKSIELLIKSSNQGFDKSTELLCIILIRKFGIDFISNEEVVDKYFKNDDALKIKLVNIIYDQQLYYKNILEIKYQLHHGYHFLYDKNYNVIDSKKIMHVQQTKKAVQIIPPVTSEFFEGFGNDILPTVRDKKG